MLALPATDMPDMTDDQAVREMTCDPRDRRVLVTDARSAFGQAVAARWSRPARASSPASPTRGSRSPAETSSNAPASRPSNSTSPTPRASTAPPAAFGGRVEILVNTALHIRPGGIIGRGDVNARARGDGDRPVRPHAARAGFRPGAARPRRGRRAPACAWVNILSVYALAPTRRSAPCSAIPRRRALALPHAARRVADRRHPRRQRVRRPARRRHGTKPSRRRKSRPPRSPPPSSARCATASRISPSAK